MKGKIAYLTLEATREGRASYAHVHEIIRGLESRGWQLELFEPSYDEDENARSLMTKILAFATAQIRLLTKTDNLQALYVRCHPASLPTLVWSKLRRIPTVLEVNGPYDDLFLAYPWTVTFGALFKRLVRSQFALADTLIVVTPQLADWIRNQVGQKPIFVVPNGANTILFNPEAQSQYLLPRPYVVFYGSLARWQGIDTLLQSVNMAEWPDEVNLVIAGDGVEQPLVKAEAERNRKVSYLGRIPFKDIPGVIANSLGGLVPKNGKGGRSDTGLSPLKVYETLACGVPVVATDFPGQADLVRNYDCGLVIKPEDPIALAQAVAYLYRNPEKAKEMGQRGRRAIDKGHSWDRRAEETEKIIFSAIDNKRQTR
jgi:glycosyltransferase involved in cell wall biosynthesis